MKFLFTSIFLNALFFVRLEILNHDDEAQYMKNNYDIDDFDERSFFVMSDLNKDNYLGRDELKRIYHEEMGHTDEGNTDEGNTDEDSEKMIDLLLTNFDHDKDGRISYDEYLAASSSVSDGNFNDDQFTQHEYF